MYNRYIPQSDGSFRKRQMPDRTNPQPVKNNTPAPRNDPSPPPLPQKPSAPISGGSVLGFLRNILPKEFDTGDLIIVLLLLLMAGDCEEEKNNALLTLALYFFM